MSNQKMCTFYVSDKHLFTIILPYINELINDKKECVIISEKDLSSSLNKILSNITSFPFEKEQIENLGFKKFKGKVDNLALSEKEVFVIGNPKYVKELNSKLEIKKVEKIINCYAIKNLEEMENIPKDYEYVLSTKGIIKISQNEQKRKTIKSQI